MRNIPDLVYVIGPSGRPLMPTKRKRHVSNMLDKGEARIACHMPYTIQILKNTTEYVQPLVYGNDPGRTNIGVSVVNEAMELLFMAEMETCNKEIPKRMAKRKTHRQASRRGERRRRQRRARACDKTGAASKREYLRILPGCKKPVRCKVIRNTESKFSHRVRPKGWLTPTANQLLLTHINLLEKVKKFLPVSDVALEINRFAFAELEDPGCTGLDFQNGPLKGFDNVSDAIYKLQGGKCLLCRKGPIEHEHHIIPKSRGGSDTLKNKAGLCNKCHDKIHTDQKAMERMVKRKEGITKKYGGASVANQIIPFLAGVWTKEWGAHFHVTFGNRTCKARESMGIVKDRKKNPCHGIDSYVIACSALEKEPVSVPDTHRFSIKQYRRHDRALIHCQKERTYKQKTGAFNKKGEPEYNTVAKNRKPRTGQTELPGSKKKHVDSCYEWYMKRCRQAGKRQAQIERSKLEVLKSKPSYNNRSRIMPGAVFWINGDRHVMRGQTTSKGITYYYSEENGQTRYRAKDCCFSRMNAGIVFVS